MENLYEEKLLSKLNERLNGHESPCVGVTTAPEVVYVLCNALAKTPQEKSDCLKKLQAGLADCDAGPYKKP